MYRLEVKKLCGHCGAKLGIKAYKEHKKLFYQEGRWLKLDLSHANPSNAPLEIPESSHSSSITLSDPGGSIGASSSDRVDLAGDVGSHKSSELFESEDSDSEVVMGPDCTVAEGK